MKCLCGYEYEKEGSFRNNGDVPFLTLKVIIESDNYLAHMVGCQDVARLYVCPKCGTVKVDI